MANKKDREERLGRALQEVHARKGTVEPDSQFVETVMRTIQRQGDGSEAVSDALRQLRYVWSAATLAASAAVLLVMLDVLGGSTDVDVLLFADTGLDFVFSFSL